jgi:hypothetical protein
MTSNGKTFNEQWAYANVIKGEIGAVSYEIQHWDGKFSSGRDQWMCYFCDSSRKVIARRIGMELTSKRTSQAYKVFSREEWRDRPVRVESLDSTPVLE